MLKQRVDETEELLQQVSGLIEENRATLRQSKETVQELRRLLSQSKSLMGEAGGKPKKAPAKRRAKK